MKKFKAIIINLETGLMDGIYYNKGMAIDVYDNWRKRFPNLWWILTENEDSIRPISNERFCARNLGQLEKANAEALDE